MARLGRSFPARAHINRFNPYIQVSGSVSGSMAASMADFTCSMTGTTTIVGTMAQTLSNFTSTMSGTETILGAMSGTLQNFTSAISGTTTIIGTIANTLVNFFAGNATDPGGGFTGDAGAASPSGGFLWIFKRRGRR